MTTRQALEEALQGLPENRLSEVLDFARFLSWQEDHEAWREFGRAQLARAYSREEPEYTIEDIKPELNS